MSISIATRGIISVLVVDTSEPYPVPVPVCRPSLDTDDVGNLHMRVLITPTVTEGQE